MKFRLVASYSGSGLLFMVLLNFRANSKQYFEVDHDYLDTDLYLLSSYHLPYNITLHN
jgi:hypothetical protein